MHSTLRNDTLTRYSELPNEPPKGIGMRKRIAGRLATVCTLAASFSLFAQQPPASNPPAVSIQTQRSQPLSTRIPQQSVSTMGVLQGLVLNGNGQPQPGVQLQLGSLAPVRTAGDGIFRLLHIPPGSYSLQITPPDGQLFRQSGVRIAAAEVLSVRITLPDSAAPALPSPLPQHPMDLNQGGSYSEISRRPDANGAVVVAEAPPLAPDAAVFQPMPDRWDTTMPGYHRYATMEVPYILGHWYDPFNRNRLKGDKPLFGRTFFSFTGIALTALDGRRLPVPADVYTARPGEYAFFGRGGQFFTAQTLRTTFDLFHGDTTAFRPVDWRIRVSTAANLNYLAARENGVVYPDVRPGTTRFDEWVGLQEAFGEVKLDDFGPNYDFASLRVGIQQFVSDFRGFIFADEQPGVRLFGNLRSNRFQWNLAAFDFLEKNTNSGLNTFHRRGRDLALANLYIQDFLAKGYTAQFSYHFLRDNASTHYDDNGFLVRPAPIGNPIPHRIDSQYIGWAGDGHIGRINITHAFYQAFGTDDYNQIAGRPTSINAQLAALELSRDHNWLRFRVSGLYASGDDQPRDGVARGFSSIVDAENFAGGEFSFFNRESIRLTGTGVALNSPDSFLPDLRSSKDEGQSNFNNPGLYLYNAGLDAKLLQTLKLVANVNFLQFARTQPLIFLLQQNGIRRTIGTDSSIGAIYRPLLSDNIVLVGGVAVLAPGRGFQQIYTAQTLISVFGTIRFQF